MELHKLKKNCIMQWKKTDIFCAEQKTSFEESFQATLSRVCWWKLKTGCQCVGAWNCGRNFFPFCGICSISTCECMRWQGFHMNGRNFPHCLWKQSVKSSVPVVPLSFLSNRCKTLLRKHLLFRFPQIFFPFLSILTILSVFSKFSFFRLSF